MRACAGPELEEEERRTDGARGGELYQFTIEERSEVKHGGLPLELECEYLASEQS